MGMNSSTSFSHRTFLFALTVAAACSAAACVNTVVDGGSAPEGIDAAKLKTKKPAIAIRYRDLPPIGDTGSSSSSSSSSGGGWGEGGAGGWEEDGSWGTTSVGVGGSGGGWGAGGFDSSSSTTSVGVGGWGSSVSTTTVGSGGWGEGGSGAGGDWGTGSWSSTATTTTSSSGGGWDCTSSSSSGGGTGIDPDTIYLKLGSTAPVCSDPNAIGGCGTWSVTIGLPPALQHEGTIRLTPEMLGSFFVQGPDEGDGLCWGGGGSLNGGTLTILEINDKHVVFRLKDTEDAFLDFNADGLYEAELCVGSAEPPPPPSGTSAIALLYSQLPGIEDPGTGSSSSTTSGGGTFIDPNTLYLKAGSYPLVCSDPYALGACPSFEVSIGIPPALQHPGVILLSSPELISSFSATGPNIDSPDCWFGGGSFYDGTIEIVSIDDRQVVFRLDNTSTFEFNANGEYTALRCP
jgi:hypothetical protein